MEELISGVSSVDSSMTSTIGLYDLLSSCPVGELVPKLDIPRNVTEEFPTEPAVPPPAWEVGLKIAFYTLSMLLAVVGNLLVIIVISTSRRLRSRTNVFILNLAVTDLLCPVCCMIPHLGNGVSAEYPFPPFVCRMSVFLQVVTVTSGVFFLTLIAVDRFFSVVFPMRIGVSRPVLAIVIVTTWTCAVAVASPLIFYTKRNQIFWANRHEVWCGEAWPAYFYQTSHEEPLCLTQTPGKTVYYTVYIVCLYLIPIFTMLLVYASIVYVLWTRPTDQGPTIDAMHQRTRRKVVRMLVVLFMAFVVCYTPMQGLILYDIYRSNQEEFPSWYSPVMYAATYLAYTNSAVNPILYAGLNGNIRRSLITLCRCYRRCQRRAVHPTSNGSRCRHLLSTAGARQGTDTVPGGLPAVSDTGVHPGDQVAVISTMDMLPTMMPQHSAIKKLTV